MAAADLTVRDRLGKTTPGLIINSMTLDEQIRAYADLAARAADVRRGL
jgi:hypothetical protein